MLARFICSHCDDWEDVDPASRKDQDPHVGCPEGDGRWLELPEFASRCPHGLEWGECEPCNIAGDLAFDSAREGRCFR